MCRVCARSVHYQRPLCFREHFCCFFGLKVVTEGAVAQSRITHILLPWWQSPQQIPKGHFQSHGRKGLLWGSVVQSPRLGGARAELWLRQSTLAIEGGCGTPKLQQKAESCLWAILCLESVPELTQQEALASASLYLLPWPHREHHYLSGRTSAPVPRAWKTRSP